MVIARTSGLGWGIACGALAAACLFAPATASAQDFYAQAQPAPAAAPATPEGGTDHDRWVGRFGLGWYGVSDIPLGPTGDEVSAPTIGVRYWFNRDIGIDAALGFTTSSGSVTVSREGQPDNVTDKPSRTGFLLHAGVPFAFHTEEHYTFLLIPELNLGFASGSVKSTDPNTPDTDLSGFRLDVGARAGAEIHFGFIGVPALALEGSVGLFFGTRSGSQEQGPNKTKNSDTFVGTTSFNNPWDFFRSSVAARYYF